MSADPVLVLATRNRGKVAELNVLLAPAGWQVRSLADFPTAPEIEETGDSFAANAALKAIGQARALSAWALGEDSGIVVDALGGPGIYSARYAGADATDEANNARLLTELAGTPLERRTAYYVCHLTLADSNGAIRAESEAICRGRIRFEPAGTAGFGYDPLFEIVEYHRTVGQLGDAVKSVLSHRARAVALLLPQLVELRPKLL